MSIATVERPVEGLYSHRFNRAKIRSSAADHQARYRFAAEIFCDAGARYVADMGCGTGESTSYLDGLLRSMNVPPQLLLGIDISSDAVARAKERTIPNATFLSANIASDGLADTIRETIPDLPSLQGIMFAETLEHISPPSDAPAALKNLKKLLEPTTGRLIITSPNRMLTSTHRYRPLNPYHAQEYSLEEFEDELRNSGLDIIILHGQRAVPKEFLKMLRPLQYVANTVPQIREVVSKVLAMMIILKQPSATVQSFERNTHEPKYFVAVCKT